MTEFEAAVTRIVAGLGPGDLVTYGEVADQAGRPGAARAVGALLRRRGGDVPWWRVVGSGGRLISPEPGRQAGLLRSEGIVVIEGRVRPARAGEGPAG